MAMNIIIFSKNRPAQLDLLLRSMCEFFPRDTAPVIIYAHDPQYADGYRQVINASQCLWHYQDGPLKEKVLEAIKPNHPHTMFLVDDDVFVRPFSYEDKEYRQFSSNKSIATLSLRLSHGLSYCYAYGTPMAQPQFEGGKYKWLNAAGDYGWLMSLDGNIYRSDEILPIIKVCDFKTPNELEGALMMHKDKMAPWVMCYPESRLINIPANKVQTTAANNKSMGGDPAALLERFYNGERISMRNLRDIKNGQTHCELNYEWTQNA